MSSTPSEAARAKPEDTREVIDIVQLNAEIKTTAANIDRLRAETDEIMAEIEGANA